MQNAFHITSKNTWQMIVKIKREKKTKKINKEGNPFRKKQKNTKDI